MPRTSSSRPTPGRGYQRMPQALQQVQQPRQDDVPDWATSPFTLYISYLHAHVPEKMLFSVLRATGLGMMRREGAIEMTTRTGGDGRDFQSAKIHFDFLFTRGEMREQNLGILDHLLHGGEDAHFQVVYQPARTNPKTGREEPDRFWKIKAWREGESRSVSPHAPSVKISLHGGSVGPKDAKKPTVQELRRAAAKRRKANNSPDGDGSTKQKSQGIDPGGAADNTLPPNEFPIKSACDEVTREVRDHLAAGGKDSNLAGYGLSDSEMAECDEAIAAAERDAVPAATNKEIADAAAEFFMESQIREEGAENAAAWQLDAATGSILLHNEMTAEQAAGLVPAVAVLDAEQIHAAE
tara:strand:+ start:1609 stop:2667 length:1059 start_codon:yes stop_codon:yes gene_type:complete